MLVRRFQSLLLYYLCWYHVNYSCYVDSIHWLLLNTRVWCHTACALHRKDSICELACGFSISRKGMGRWVKSPTGDDFFQQKRTQRWQLLHQPKWGWYHPLPLSHPFCLQSSYHVQCTAPMTYTWWLTWLAVEQPWLTLDRMFLILLAQVGQKPLSPFEVFDHRHMNCLLD